MGVLGISMPVVAQSIGRDKGVCADFFVRENVKESKLSGPTIPPALGRENRKHLPE
jgi:hypothetical protein